MKIVQMNSNVEKVKNRSSRPRKWSNWTLTGMGQWYMMLYKSIDTLIFPQFLQNRKVQCSLLRLYQIKQDTVDNCEEKVKWYTAFKMFHKRKSEMWDKLLFKRKNPFSNPPECLQVLHTPHIDSNCVYFNLTVNEVALWKSPRSLTRKFSEQKKKQDEDWGTQQKKAKRTLWWV